MRPSGRRASPCWPRCCRGSSTMVTFPCLSGEGHLSPHKAFPPPVPPRLEPGGIAIRRGRCGLDTHPLGRITGSVGGFSNLDRTQVVPTAAPAPRGSPPELGGVHDVITSYFSRRRGRRKPRRR